MFPAFMTPERNLLPQAAILSVTYSIMCLCTHFSIAFAGEYIRRFLNSPNRLRFLRRSLGGAFICFGLSLAASRV